MTTQICNDPREIRMICVDDHDGGLWYTAGEGGLISITPYLEGGMYNSSVWFLLSYEDGHVDRINGRFVWRASHA